MQPAMRLIGVKHMLDDGNLTLPSGSRISVDRPSYSVEISFEPPVSTALGARTSIVPLDAGMSRSGGHPSPSRGSGCGHRHSPT